ncbi:Flp/Fap pilin component [compost metagenome]
MSMLNAFWKKLQRDERGVTSIEYALLGALIAMAIVGGVSVLGVEVEALYKLIAAQVPSQS